MSGCRLYFSLRTSLSTTWKRMIPWQCEKISWVFFTQKACIVSVYYTEVLLQIISIGYEFPVVFVYLLPWFFNYFEGQNQWFYFLFKKSQSTKDHSDVHRIYKNETSTFLIISLINPGLTKVGLRQEELVNAIYKWLWLMQSNLPNTREVWRRWKVKLNFSKFSIYRG